jgi:ribonuclease-3
MLQLYLKNLKNNLFFLNKEDKKFNKKLKMLLGFKPGNIFLYKQAFTHKSSIEQKNHTKQSNERLEFLGDAILDAVITSFLYKKYPNADEGFLTKLRSKTVSRNMLNHLGKKMGLDKWLIYTDKFSSTMIGNTFEALIGAIFLDKGYNKAEKFITEKILLLYIDFDELLQTENDYKSKLVEYSQQEKIPYEFLCQEKTVNNKTTYTCSLVLNNKIVAKGTGRSKKQAEQEASKIFFTIQTENKL